MSRRRAAFTLIEIMFALVAGLIAISVVYSLNTGTTRLLAEQNRVSGLQTSLRLAMEQIRADIERAGFHVSPNSAGETVCGTPAFTVEALQYSAGAFTNNVPNASAHGVVADRLRMMGNYVTSGAYLMGTMDATGSTLPFQLSWQSFRRDFGVSGSSSNGGAATIDLGSLERAFPAGRMLHVLTQENHHAYVTVTGVTGGTAPSVQITPPLTPGGICMNGLGTGSTIAPVNRVEYAILRPTAGSILDALVHSGTGATEAIEGIPSVLVRYEVDANGTRLDQTMRVVLENAVEFSLSFDLDETSGPTNPPTLVQNRPNFGSSPQKVRAVRVRLSARTGEADPSLPFVRRQAGAALTRYYARDNDVAGAEASRRPSSRVRTLTSIVFVPNLAYADMQ